MIDFINRFWKFQKIPCDGMLTKWKFIDFNPEKGKSFYADILNYDQARDRITWMGSNLVVSNGQHGWQTFNVPSDQQIRVEKDWRIAIHYAEIDDDLAVVPATENSIGGQITTGFQVLIDHSEAISFAEIGKEVDVSITGMLSGLNIAIGTPFRTPALSAIIE